MSLLLFLATLPSLYWAQPVETAPAVRQAGIERLCVPPEAAAAWQSAGFSVVPFGEKERAARVKLRAPGVAGRAEVASATNRPWVFANGWRYLRASDGRFWSEVPARQSALATAEAFVYRADVVLAIDPAGLEDVGRMLAFLSSVPEADLPAVADIAVQDDGSPLVGEVLNLMARGNLLFKVVRAPAPDVALNVRIGSKEFPRKDAQNPGRVRARGAPPADRRAPLPSALRQRGGARPARSATPRARACTSSTTAGGRSRACASASSGAGPRPRRSSSARAARPSRTT